MRLSARLAKEPVSTSGRSMSLSRRNSVKRFVVKAVQDRCAQLRPRTRRHRVPSYQHGGASGDTDEPRFVTDAEAERLKHAQPSKSYVLAEESTKPLVPEDKDSSS